MTVWLLHRLLSGVNSYKGGCIVGRETFRCSTTDYYLLRRSVEYKTILNQLANRCSMDVVWGSWHRDIPWNYIADALAPLLGHKTVNSGQHVGIPLSTNKLWITEPTQLVRYLWPRRNEHRTTCRFLINQDRFSFSTLVGIIIRHCLIGTYVKRMWASSNDLCHNCRIKGKWSASNRIAISLCRLLHFRENLSPY